jgi:hypothetical protein
LFHELFYDYCILIGLTQYLIIHDLRNELLLFVQHWDFGADDTNDVIVDVFVVAFGDEFTEKLLRLLDVQVRFCAVSISVFVIGVLAPCHMCIGLLLLLLYLIFILAFALGIIQLVLL